MSVLLDEMIVLDAGWDRPLRTGWISATFGCSQLFSSLVLTSEQFSSYEALTTWVLGSVPRTSGHPDPVVDDALRSVVAAFSTQKVAAANSVAHELDAWAADVALAIALEKTERVRFEQFPLLAAAFAGTGS